MTRESKALTVMLVAALGAWGCARGPGSHYAAQAEKIRALEGKCSKLEDDYKAVAGARDQARRRVTSLEEENARLHRELVEHRTVLRERDALQLRCDRLKKGLQNLLGQDDATASQAAGQPVTSSAAAVTSNPW
jgi:hypothetical protein